MARRLEMLLASVLVLGCGGDSASPAGTDPMSATDPSSGAVDPTTGPITTDGDDDSTTSTGAGPEQTETGSSDSSGSSSSGGMVVDLPCPDGAMGPPMVKLLEGYCIDATEVTRGQYAAWLDTLPDLDAMPPHCAWNEDLTPSCAWPPGSTPDFPVACVDWCDAAAYCDAAGKRLCGRIGGGPNEFDALSDTEQSQWFNACSSGGAHDYTYGDRHDPSACRGADEDKWAWNDVGTLPGCQSPTEAYAGVFDLSGNVMEWEDSCDADAGSDDHCRVRGGSFNSSGTGLRCDASETLLFPRHGAYVGIGFRCCAS